MQVPGYLEQQDELKAAGVHEVIVYCVNDGAVMEAWAKDQGVEQGPEGLLTFMGDPSGQLTKALDMLLDHPGPQSKGIINRCKRFALYLESGVVKAIKVSEAPDDPAGDDNPEATCAPAILEVIRGVTGGKSEL